MEGSIRNRVSAVEHMKHGDDDPDEAIDEHQGPDLMLPHMPTDFWDPCFCRGEAPHESVSGLGIFLGSAVLQNLLISAGRTQRALRLCILGMLPGCREHPEAGK